MTESEAIKWHKQIEETFKGFHLDIEEKMNISCDMAINALEKQIAKKPNDEIKTIPVIDEDGAYVDADTYVYLLCPICGNQVGIDDCIDNYCSCCGQKLDRSDID